jgi:hypothetical protein
VTAAPPPLALSVSPARVAVVAPASRTIELRNAGAATVVIDVAGARRWLEIRPRHAVLRARARAVVTLRVRARAHGDHQLLVLVSARPRAAGRVALRMRLGVRVRIHDPGRAVRRLELQWLRVHTRQRVRELLLSVVNRGTVAEQLRRRLTVTLLRRGRIVSRLRPRALPELFPGARTVVVLPYFGGVRGPVSALVRVRLGRARPTVVRRYRLRL